MLGKKKSNIKEGKRKSDNFGTFAPVKPIELGVGAREKAKRLIEEKRRRRERIKRRAEEIKQQQKEEKKLKKRAKMKTILGAADVFEQGGTIAK